MGDDNWDDEYSLPSSSGVGVKTDEGVKFSSGRGFSKSNNEWGNGSNDNDSWGGGSGANHASSNGNWGGRGGGGDRPFRGRGGGRGGRGGGRGGGRSNGGGWGDSGDNEASNSGWGDSEDSGNRRGGRGGGRGGGRSNGGGWGDSGDNGASNGGWGGDSEDFGERRGGRGGGRGGRGGRGGGSGRGGFRNNDGEDGYRSNNYEQRNNGEEGEEEKKREIYIPEERQNEEELFLDTISSGINFIKLDETEVNVSGDNPPAPVQTFESSGLRPHVLDNVRKSQYTKMTPIQKHALPIIMNGRDLMGCAQTGSGKTAAFLLPIINKLLELQESVYTEGNCASPQVIIVSPTRELAIQIKEQARKFAAGSIIKIAIAYGGTSVGHQSNAILSGCHILVATPGRLNDFVKRGKVSFGNVKFFVLDEADRMLDMGFLPTVEEMLSHSTMVPAGERQTLMFSATFPEEIQQLAGKFLHNYIFVAVGIVGSASSDVEQKIYQVSKFDKREKLLELLKENNKEMTVVFVETKRNADFLASLLSEADMRSTSIHGDRLQREREQALWDFKKGISRILVATGVAARGLDIKGIQHVINYDLPNSIDEYVHRIGRTGRVGNRGKATSFFDPNQDQRLAGDLAKILRQANQEVPDWLSSAGSGGDYGSSDVFGGRDIRGDDFGRAQNFSTQPAEEPEEEW